MPSACGLPSECAEEKGTEELLRSLVRLLKFFFFSFVCCNLPHEGRRTCTNLEYFPALLLMYDQEVSGYDLVCGSAVKVTIFGGFPVENPTNNATVSKLF